MNLAEMTRSNPFDDAVEHVAATKRIFNPMLGRRLQSIDHVRVNKDDGHSVICLGFSDDDAPGSIDLIPIHAGSARTLRVGNPERIVGRKAQVVEVRWEWVDAGDSVAVVRTSREWIPLDHIPEARLRELLKKLHRRNMMIPGRRR